MNKNHGFLWTLGNHSKSLGGKCITRDGLVVLIYSSILMVLCDGGYSYL